jgi:sialic acid synthase SpsE
MNHESTVIIAEIGSCHDGSIDKALALVRAAADAGADIVKAQYWSDPDKLAERRRVPDYYREFYKRYQVPDIWLPVLSTEADAHCLDFMATAYLPSDVPVLAEFVKHFKVASFEADSTDLLEAHWPIMELDLKDRRDRWLMVSLGMGARGPEVPWYLTHAYRPLLCTSSYPAPVESLNIRAVRKLSGFSDHSDPAMTWTGALAVAAGAKIIEAHLRLHETDPENPDAPHAMTPEQFDNYVRHIRWSEVALGPGERRLQDAEKKMAKYKVNR